MDQKVIKFTRISQRQGRVENLPTLASAEFGFAQDSGQLFIGSDPALATNIEHDAVCIVPFLNAQEVVQGYLDDSDYSSLVVDNDLRIRIDSETSVFDVVNYINEKHNENTTVGRKAIAFVDSNIEVVTSKNVHQYASPSEFVVRYNPTEQINSHRSKTFYTILSDTDGDVFYQQPFSGALYLNIEYMLIQDDGRHVRSGMLKVIADTEASSGTIASMIDERNDLKSIPGGLTNANKIEFSTETDENNVYVKFKQPVEARTKIFYRVNRWHVEDYKHLNNFDTDSYIGPLK